MQSNKIKPPPFPLEFYPDELLIVKGIKFTPRQIDIMACLISGGTGKTISSLLSIEIKTIEAHKKDIVGRLGGGVQENIIAFIQTSNKYDLIKKHYLKLLKKVKFEKQLKELDRGIDKNQLPHCSIEPKSSYHPQAKNKSSFLNIFTFHLSLVGIKILEKSNQPEHYPEATKVVEQILYFIDGDLIGHLKSDQIREGDFKDSLKLASSSQEIIHIVQDLTFKEELLKISPNTNPIDFTSPVFYFKSFITLLERMIPSYDFASLKEIIDDNDLNFKDFNQNSSVTKLQGSSYKTFARFSLLPNILPSKRKQALSIVLLATPLLSFCFWAISEIVNPSDQKANNRVSLDSIHSDLIIPSDSSFLNRPRLMTEIENKFKEGQGIQSVALVGVGGAGKTTLARTYARKQKCPVVWEINAETKESFVSSFESLAYALAKTQEEKKTLKILLDIKEASERQHKTLFFVKEKLRIYQPWLLIFDNVEKLSDIYEYFPIDSNVWGKGKVIVTTQDNNIVNNNQINAMLIIGGLDHQQKLSLFTKIMDQGNSKNTIFPYKEQTIKFLENIPSFPLDILIAAYYIKATNISYETYLERLKKYDQPFTLMQQDILKDANDYKKTRFSIIALSLKRLIATNKEFKDLLLLLCLIDSQNIPRILLDKLKDKNIVDNFIYNLKKYSFVTTNSQISSLLSLHRSTQEISLNYLLKLFCLEKNNNSLQEITNTLACHMENSIETEDHAKMKLLVNHGERFLSHQQLLSKTLKGIIGSELGFIYCYLGDYKRAKELLIESLVYLQENQSKLAKALSYLGIVYREISDYKKARSLLEQSLSIYKKLSPKNDVKLAQTLIYLGSIERDTGHYSKAISLFKNSLTILKSYFPQNHIKIAQALVYLGSVERDAGHYSKAKKLLEEGLEIYQNIPNKNYLGESRALIYLGNVYRELGDYQRAKTLFEDSIAIYKQYLSEDYVSYAWAIALLGNVYRNLGDYKKAQDLLEQSLKIYKSSFPEDHVGVAWVSVHLANTYKKLKEFQKAKNLLENSIIIYKKHFSENYVGVAWASVILADIYRNLGNYNEAKNLIESSLVIYNKHFPSDHNDIAWASLHLGNIYIDLKQYQKAKDLIERGYTIYKKSFPSGHVKVKQALASLDKLYKIMNQA